MEGNADCRVSRRRVRRPTTLLIPNSQTIDFLAGVSERVLEGPGEDRTRGEAAVLRAGSEAKLFRSQMGIF